MNRLLLYVSVTSKCRHVNLKAMAWQILVFLSISQRDSSNIVSHIHTILVSCTAKKGVFMK